MKIRKPNRESYRKPNRKGQNWCWVCDVKRVQDGCKCSFCGRKVKNSFKKRRYKK